MKNIIKYKKSIVLIIDNDESLIDMMKTLLDSSNIDCVTATNYEEARHILTNVSISLVIADYHLDGKRPGTDVVEFVKREKPHIPVVMLSGDHSDIVRIGSLEAGANVFLTKPVDFNDFIKIIKNALTLVNVYEDLEDAENIILALTRAVELKDTYTEGHSHRVAQYSLDLFDQLELDDWTDRNSLYVGCLLHDIGKLGIPDNILKSENKLTQEERDEVEKHSIKGFEVCRDLTRLGDALRVIKHHHEKIDGSGYPDGLSGDDIPLIVRIATIADIYDALTSKRSYRHRNTQSEAFKIMQNEVVEGKIDEFLFRKFKRMIVEKTY